MLRMLRRIKKSLDHAVLKDESRKIGVNLVTAGIVGVFIYHYVGTSPISMFWASAIINFLGVIAILIGSRKKGDSQ